MSILKTNIGSTAIACLFAIGSVVSAQQPGQNQQQQDKEQNSPWVQQLSQHVDLQDDQKSEISRIIQQHNQKLNSAWQQFNQAHMQTVSLEASLYASLEQNMNSQQREQFRRNREQNSNNPELTATNERNEDRKMRETQYREGADSGQKSPEAYANQSGERPSGQDSQPDRNRNANRQQDSTNPDDYYVTAMILVPAEKAYSGSGLDENSRQQCDQVCEQYKSNLSQAWKNVRQHHNRLVKLEAEKLQQIENVLTDEQMKQIRDLKSGQSNSQNDQNDGR